MVTRHLSLSIIVFFLYSYIFTWHLVFIDAGKGSGAYGTDVEVDSLGYFHIIYKDSVEIPRTASEIIIREVTLRR